jgi:hypothetical protein
VRKKSVEYEVVDEATAAVDCGGYVLKRSEILAKCPK